MLTTEWGDKRKRLESGGQWKLNGQDNGTYTYILTVTNRIYFKMLHLIYICTYILYIYAHIYIIYILNEIRNGFILKE